MKIPIYCPKCGDVLLSEEMLFFGKDVWSKKCTKRLGHKFSVFYNINEADINSLCIQISKNVDVLWDFRNELLSVSKPGKSLKELMKSTQFIPYFEPDLSNWKKLISKLKTYILFL
jgi:hypothetical protein